MPKKKSHSIPDLQVWGSRVLLRAVGTEVVQEKVGSLWMPQSSAEERQRNARWEIAGVGPDVQDPDLALGAEVICRKWATEEFRYCDTVYRVAAEDQIIAVLLT